MGDAASKTVNNAVDQVKGAVTNAAHGLQGAAANVGNAAGEAVNNITGQVKKEADNILSPGAKADPPEKHDTGMYIPLKTADEKPSDSLKVMDELMTTPPQSPNSETATSPSKMFKPTPVPSFDKPPTPSATVASLADILETSMEKIDETVASPTIEELTDALMKETAAVGEDLPPLDDEELDKATNLELDLQPTKWEALADAIVELPPRMSIDLGTGQIYAVVDEDPPPRHKPYHARPAVIKEVVKDAIKDVPKEVIKEIAHPAIVTNATS